MVDVKPVPVDVGRLPEIVQQGIAPDSPPERRLLLARAALPLAPDDLVPTLALLAQDKSDTVSQAARASIDKLPPNMLGAAVVAASDPGVLDYFARTCLTNDALVLAIARNNHTADDTVVYLAARGRGQVLEVIAANQMRQHRCPRIIEGLYYNPEARMGTVSNVLEGAVRMGIDLTHIPGYIEIVTSILGAAAAHALSPKNAPVTPAPEVAPAPQAALPPFELPADLPLPSAAGGELSADMQAMQAELERALAQAGVGSEAAVPAGEGVDDALFTSLLQAAVAEEGAAAPQVEGEKTTGAIWNKLDKMSIPQKVRLALLGSDFVRSFLIRDPRRVVYMAVLNSPKVTEKDIIGFAKNKGLGDDIVRYIAGNRDWTKLYAVKIALAQNPKCPPIPAMQVLRSLLTKDLKTIGTSHDCPGFISRQARQIASERDAGKRSGP